MLHLLFIDLNTSPPLFFSILGQSAEEAKSLGPEQGGDDEETLTEKRHQEWTARKMERHRGHEAQRD